MDTTKPQVNKLLPSEQVKKILDQTEIPGRLLTGDALSRVCREHIWMRHKLERIQRALRDKKYPEIGVITHFILPEINEVLGNE